MSTITDYIWCTVCVVIAENVFRPVLQPSYSVTLPDAKIVTAQTSVLLGISQV
jgi:hypothetical protein